MNKKLLDFNNQPISSGPYRNVATREIVYLNKPHKNSIIQHGNHGEVQKLFDLKESNKYQRLTSQDLQTEIQKTDLRKQWLNKIYLSLEDIHKISKEDFTTTSRKNTRDTHRFQTNKNFKQKKQQELYCNECGSQVIYAGSQYQCHGCGNYGPISECLTSINKPSTLEKLTEHPFKEGGKNPLPFP